jgi:hypothetical protein
MVIGGQRWQRQERGAVMASQYNQCKYCSGGILKGQDICPFCRRSQTTGAGGVSSVPVAVKTATILAKAGLSTVSPDMKKWGYITARRDSGDQWWLLIDGNITSISEDPMQTLGEQGWELVSIITDIVSKEEIGGQGVSYVLVSNSYTDFFFKRPKN